MYNDQIHVSAGADLSAAQYKAVAIGGTIAANNDAAVGLLINQPSASGRDAAVAVAGRAKFVAGAAVAAGAGVRVTTSGYLITVASGYLPCGFALEAVTSGSTGEGYFNFANAKFTVGSA